MLITSKDNDIVKHIKKLKDKKGRDESGEFIVEGWKMLEEAINENARIKSIIVCDDCNEMNKPEAKVLYEVAKENIIYVTEKIFKILSDVMTPQGVLAIIEKQKLSEIDYKDDLYLILDNIQDPGNLGTIIRTADSINLKQIIVPKGSADPFNPKVVRSSMGAIFRVRVIDVDNLEKTVKELKKHNISIYATDLKTDKSIYDVDYKKSAIVIGNEANGVSKEILNLADKKIKIPMLGKTESLNAAVATGIILYNAVRK